ncbi:MAG: hypothetical protein D6812_17910 [Deltaproteobacteria bacterium]|nr:MAG: hypothetical protein D6812_17910 [Deltaproteobacteria bacterium]
MLRARPQLIMLVICLYGSGCLMLESTHRQELEALGARHRTELENADRLRTKLALELENCRNRLTAANARVETLDALAARVQKELVDTSKSAAVLESELDKCHQEWLLQEMEKGELSQDLQATLERSRRLERLLAEREAVFNDLVRSLKVMRDAGTVRVEIVHGLLVVRLNERVLFDVNEARLKADGKKAVAELTAAIRNLPGRRWQIAGHTDATGPPDFNWRLSMERALSVLIYMIEEGMPPDRISAAGFGPYQPIAPNDTPAGRALNRRIDVILVPDFGALELPANPAVDSEGPATASTKEHHAEDPSGE